VARSGDIEVVAEFSVADLGFQGRFSAGLGAELSFCLHSISPFHTALLCVFLLPYGRLLTWQILYRQSSQPFPLFSAF
jgi:hypothetical protein